MKCLHFAIVLAIVAMPVSAQAQVSADCKKFEAQLSKLAADLATAVDGIEDMLPDHVEQEGATGSVDLNALEEELKTLLPAEAAVPLTDFAGSSAVLLPKLVEARDWAKTASDAMTACAAGAN